MGLRMVQDNNIIGPEEFLLLNKPAIIRELESRGATGGFLRWRKKELRDFLIEVLWDSKLFHLHSEYKGFD